MGVTLKQGQVWEDSNGHRFRIIDEKVDSQTEVYIAPVTLEIELVESTLPNDVVDISDDTGDDVHQVRRDTLLHECELIDDHTGGDD